MTSVVRSSGPFSAAGKWEDFLQGSGATNGEPQLYFERLLAPLALRGSFGFRGPVWLDLSFTYLSSLQTLRPSPLWFHLFCKTYGAQRAGSLSRAATLYCAPHSKRVVKVP